MNVSRADLYRLIIEEYAKEEGIEISEDKADDLLDYIRGGERPQWMDDSEKEVPAPPEVPPAPEKEDSDTFVMDTLPGADMSDEDIVSTISQMIQGRDPEHVSELFQAVFAQIPGVEMGDAEEEPESLYSPGAEGRPVAGFQLEELMELIREVLEEGHYHDMTDELDYPDPVDEIVQKAWDAGIRFPEPLTDRSKLKNEDKEKLYELMHEAAGGMSMGRDASLRYMEDIIEELWKKQDENEDV
jgi:hypothetical protein